MSCPACNDTGCDECKQNGRIEIVGCPLEYVTDNVWEVIRFAELYKKGLPPVHGGALDQAYCFIRAAEFIFSEIAVCKREAGAIDL